MTEPMTKREVRDMKTHAPKKIKPGYGKKANTVPMVGRFLGMLDEIEQESQSAQLDLSARGLGPGNALVRMYKIQHLASMILAELSHELGRNMQQHINEKK